MATGRIVKKKTGVWALEVEESEATTRTPDRDRIHGEWTKLGYDAVETTVSKYMARHTSFATA